MKCEHQFAHTLKLHQRCESCDLSACPCFSTIHGHGRIGSNYSCQNTLKPRYLDLGSEMPFSHHNSHHIPSIYPSVSVFASRLPSSNSNPSFVTPSPQQSSCTDGSS
mmetsp:Transcript_3485/g.13287  ORF Transcript_3485/g.13287 Transcript_3485/m.13287 type:complete len:107 (-) Transcript_3485:483-803(-)